MPPWLGGNVHPLARLSPRVGHCRPPLCELDDLGQGEPHRALELLAHASVVLRLHRSSDVLARAQALSARSRAAFAAGCDAYRRCVGSARCASFQAARRSCVRAASSKARRGSEQHGDGHPDCAHEAGCRGQHDEHGKPRERIDLWDCVGLCERGIAVRLHVLNLDTSGASMERQPTPRIGGRSLRRTLERAGSPPRQSASPRPR